MVSASPQFDHRSRERQLARMRTAVTGDAIGAFRVHVLQRELDMVQANRLQLGKPCRVETSDRGDQVGIEPGLVRRRDNVDQVAARCRLAAGQVDLQHAQRGGLAKHPGPGRSIQLVRAILQRQRIANNTDTQGDSDA